MSGGRRGKRIRASPGPLFSQELLSLNRSLSHTHTDTHTEGWIHAPLSGLPLLLISLTRGLQHFLPVHQEILKPDPTVSHGDLLEEVGHSSVLHPLLSHPPPSRMNLCPVSILRIKEEAHLSTEAELPGSTDVSIIFTLTCHPALQGERVCPCGGKVLSLWV